MKTKLLHRLRVKASKKFYITKEDLGTGELSISVRYLDDIWGLRYNITCGYDEESSSMEKAFKVCDDWQRNYILRKLNLIRKFKIQYGK